MNILMNNIIVKGGWVMIPIILGSIIAFGLTVERGMLLWKIRLDVKKFTDDILFLVGKGDFTQAQVLCRNTPHPVGKVFLAGLEHRGEDAAFIERIMEHEGNDQVTRLEKNMTGLMTIIGVEPLLGFLGTIIGLINAFMAWEIHATTVTVEQLAAGIYQAMITTAGGLLVAIPYYIVYNIFTGRINAAARELNHHGEDLVRALTVKKKVTRKK